MVLSRPLWKACETHPMKALYCLSFSSLFSMDGDFAPMTELVKLRKKHGFLLVIDDVEGNSKCSTHNGRFEEADNCTFPMHQLPR
ncbi:hypothetical protein LguiB_001159 [Lonicera macranthoides]